MKYQVLTRLCAGLTLAAFASSAAHAQAAWQPGGNAYSRNAATKSAALKWELGYLALGAIDTAETIDCLKRDICIEGNPILGKRPSAAKLIGLRVGLSLLHYSVFSRVNDRNPKGALRLAQISCALQGTVVGLNARFIFD